MRQQERNSKYRSRKYLYQSAGYNSKNIQVVGFGNQKNHQTVSNTVHLDHNPNFGIHLNLSLIKPTDTILGNRSFQLIDWFDHLEISPQTYIPYDQLDFAPDSSLYTNTLEYESYHNRFVCNNMYHNKSLTIKIRMNCILDN